jgi:DNA-entry nuclease
MKKITSLLASLVLIVSLLFTACDSSAGNKAKNPAPDNKAKVTQRTVNTKSQPSFDLSSIPEFSGKPYVVINNNVPSFPDKDKVTKSFEHYSKLDSLGRCGAAYANISRSTMPTEKRGRIGKVKPTGWHIAKYEGIDGKYLYNRCHLIGYQLTAENANPRNLITGTRYLNVTGMLPFENMVADYVKETNHHVLYRVTPIFKDSELVARGVQMEAYSVEDKGAGVQFNVYAYNNQPGIIIDYKTGNSRRQ